MKKYKKLTVVLAHDIDEETFKKMSDVIYMIRGVLKVEGGEVKEKDYVANTRAKSDLIKALWEVVGVSQ